jgi:hypothetical protein
MCSSSGAAMVLNLTDSVWSVVIGIVLPTSSIWTSGPWYGADMFKLRLPGVVHWGLFALISKNWNIVDFSTLIATTTRLLCLWQFRPRGL